METKLRCETCKRRIEALSEEEVLNDIEEHGWTNWKTANSIKCFDCATDYDAYETYYAGRIKRGHPDRVYRMALDLKTKKLMECYSERLNFLPTLKGGVSVEAM